MEADPHEFFWAHPRVCGEHEMPGMYTRPQWGSSPRLRGARKPDVVVFPVLRLIPASAGSTRW